MALKRSASASPEVGDDVAFKQPRLVSEAETPPMFGLRTPAMSLPPSGVELNSSCKISALPVVEPASDPDFIAAFANVGHISGRIANALKHCPLTIQADSSLAEILASATELQKNHINTEYVIGLVGDAGQGKSSTVNSVLDIEGLAKIGNAGTSVTAFVTEFRERPMTQESEFYLQAELLSGQEIDELLHELLVKALEGSPRNPEYEDQKKELSREEFDLLEAEAVSALNTLDQIFPNEAIRHVEKYNFKQGHVTRIIKALRQSLNCIAWPGSDRVWSSSAISIEECQAFTGKVMLHQLAPFVKIMRVYLHSRVLASGAVIADIPGLRDTNTIRVRTALNYTAQCDGLLVVNRIGRIASSRTVLDEVRRFRRMKPKGAVKGYYPSVGIVATCSNDINNFTEYPSEYHVSKDDFEAKKKSYYDKKKKAGEEHLWARFDLENLHSGPRNAFVESSLKAQDPASPTDIPLVVFCIDNQDYFADEDSDEYNAARRNRSGVLQLQDHCMALPARQRFKEINNTIQGRLPHLIQTLAFWVKASQDGDLGYTEPLDIQDLESELVEGLRTACEVSQDTCANAVKIPNTERTELRRKVGELVLSWNSLSYGTIKAFCRRGGIFAPRNRGLHNWNEEVMKLLDQNASLHWQQAEEEAITQIEGFGVEMGNVCQELSEKARKAQYPSSFLDSLHLKRNEVNFQITTLVPRLKKQLDILHANVTEFDTDSYIAEYLTNPYHACSATCGKGAKRTCIDILMKHLQGANNRYMVFTRIIDMFIKDLDAYYHEMQNELKVLVQRIIHEIGKESGSIKQSVESVEVLENHPDFAQRLHECLADAKSEMKKNEELTREARFVARERGYID